uniref:Uncharacterized protein n=1 Tax=Romanomermis culicivorax TaxID=13658 RepID=A0A915HNH4_ROMCU
MCACLARLKSDIKLIESTFPKSHERFQILNASVDEVSCKFITRSDTKHIIANILENYPESPPVWFCDSGEDATVSHALSNLTDTSRSQENMIIPQICKLITTLSHSYSLPVPPQVAELTLTYSSSTEKKNEDHTSDLESDDDNIDYEMEEDVRTENSDTKGLSPDDLAMLDKLKRKHISDYKSCVPTGSVTANDRLMKELRDIYRSTFFKNGDYSIELVGIYLHTHLISCVRTLTWSDSQSWDAFPFDPPFVRIVSPYIVKGFVLYGGAICMELLTKQGWSSVYSVEAIIHQIAATLVKGKARIQFDAKMAVNYTNQLILPVLESFNDPDSRIRYYACEALYNIIKITREATLVHFKTLFDTLARLVCDVDQNVRNGADLLDRSLKDIVTASTTFRIGEFVTELRERIYVQALHNVPQINLVPFLPDILDGFFHVLSDDTPRTRETCEAVLGEFLKSIEQKPQAADLQHMVNILIVHAQSQDDLVRLIALIWLREFLLLDGNNMLKSASGYLTAVLPCLSFTDDQKKNYENKFEQRLKSENIEKS